MFPLTSRFKLLERPAALPGKCATCGATDRAVVDFGLSLDFYGAVYFCVTCMSECAKGLDYISKEEHEQVLTHLAVADATQNAALTIIGEFHESQRRALLSLSDDLAALRIPGVGTEGVAEGSQGNSSAPTKGTSRKSKDSGQASNDVGNEGPFSLPSSTSDESADFGFSLPKSK